MRLLIITQKVDYNDPVLGFFHRWIVEFAKKFESIIVVCLEEGQHELPENVRVLSLGKEERQSRLQYLIHFYWYIQHERKNYDAVFVHMNQEYVFLAGWLWRLWGKKVTMWRNHYAGSLLTDLAARFCHKIFCTSKYSYTAKFKQTSIMPVGIDVEAFKPVLGETREPGSILFLGRIAPSKRPHILIDAFGMLHKDGVKFQSSIYGEPLAKDADYCDNLKKQAVEQGLKGIVSFCGAVKHEETPAIYSRHDIFVNLSPSGMYDKTIFEAMACGCLALSSNKNLEEYIDPALLFHESDARELSDKLMALMTMPEEKSGRLRKSLGDFVRTRHSLDSLAEGLRSSIQSLNSK